jgi:hypothetical protein
MNAQLLPRAMAIRSVPFCCTRRRQECACLRACINVDVQLISAHHTAGRMNDDGVAGRGVLGIKRFLYPEWPEMLAPHEPGGVTIAPETEFEAGDPVICASVHHWPACRWHCFIGYMSHGQAPCSRAFRGVFGIFVGKFCLRFRCRSSLYASLLRVLRGIFSGGRPCVGQCGKVLSNFGAARTKGDVRSGRECDARSQRLFSSRTAPAECRSGRR